MKKVNILLFSIMFLFFLGTAFSQSITVTSPNGSENWQIGSTHNITWNSSGVPGNIIIKLMKGGSMLGSIAYNIANSGSYSWTINNIAGNPIVAGSNYKVLVRSFNDHSIEDQSNSNFTISSTPSGGSITVTNPDGGEIWPKNSTKNITWNSSGVSGNIIIKLMKGGSMLGSIAYNIANTGSYSWTINNIDGNPIASGSNYKVLVRSFDNHSIEDQSSTNFTISDGEILIPWYKFKLYRIPKLRIDPDPGPYIDPLWKLHAQELIKNIQDHVKALPEPIPGPVGIFLIGESGKPISKLGVIARNGNLRWEVQRQGETLLIKPGKERGRHMLKSRGGEFKIILKNMRTGELVREIPVETEIR